MQLGRRFVLGVSTTSLVLMLARVALAEPTASDKAAAEALYDEGRQLLRTGKLDEACGKLAESQRLDPGTGTLLYLGECYERSGKLASAWATFREANASAHAANQEDRAKLAQGRAATLEPRLPRLTIRLSVQAPGTEVRHGDAIVRLALLGTATPVDPGSHEITVHAPGYKAWSKTVQLEPASAVTVDIPELEKESSAPPVPADPSAAAAASTSGPSQVPPEAPPPSSQGLSGRKLAALAVGGVGVIGIGVGAFMGLRAFSSWSDVERSCPNDRCPATARESIDSASTSATVSTVAMIVGAGCVGGGAILWFTGSTEPARKSGGGRALVPVVGLGTVGVAGRF